MCGILGRFYREPSRRSALTETELATLAHRGPDGRGTYTDSHVQLGHTRLAIIDLTQSGHQPMSYGNGRYVVSYNGEIYNYLELRDELIAKGERFTSRSDTEVLLAAYKTWGTECVHHFRGMFALALWDERERTLFLARDRCGEKPIFYYRTEECFYFASELKGLLPLLPVRPTLDVSVADMYLHYQYVPEPFTLLQGVHKLSAGHTLLISADHWHANSIRYWTVEEPPKISGLPTDTEGALRAIREGLEEAVSLTLRSDVPVGVALSGGIDSGAIAAYAQKHSSKPLHAFCVGYPGRPPYDEREQAHGLARELGVIVHDIELPVDHFVEFFPHLVRIMDEPIADPAAFGHYSVPKAAADAGIKVLLTGIGGDEVFWGYSWVAQAAAANEALAAAPWITPTAALLMPPMAERILKRMAMSTRVPGTLRQWAKIFIQSADMYTPKDQLHFYTGVQDFNDARGIKGTIYGPAMNEVDDRNPFRPTCIGPRSAPQVPAAVIRMLFDTWLASNCLTLGDRVGMSVGVEARLPFLDVRLIERVMALRHQKPDHALGQKAWLRAALKGVLPGEVLTRPKAGFQPPVWEWLSGVVAKYGDRLRGGHLVQCGVLRSDKVDYVLQQMIRQGWPGLFFAYKLLLLEMWHREVVHA